MTREVVRQNDFSGGEIAPEFAASGDREVTQRSLKRGRNVRILNSFGVTQRPGSRRIVNIASAGVLVAAFTSQDEDLEIVLRATIAEIRTKDGALLQTLTGLPWTAAQVKGVTWTVRADEVYIAHAEIWPVKLTRDDGVWSWAYYAFDAGEGGTLLQLYFKFAGKQITLTPSARTGSIGLVFSDDVLQSGHVETRFRYQSQEILITAVADAQNGTGTVVGNLPPTYNMHVMSSAGFRIGDDVQGQTSLTRGIVSAIPDSTHVTIQVYTNYSGFQVLSDTSHDPEYITGPFANSQINPSSPQTEVSPAATAVWDEQVFSTVRGFPANVFQRSQRLGFADFPYIPDALALSAPGAPQDFDLGGGDPQDAIFEQIGNSGGQRILYCMDAGSLIVLTDRGVYYLPESPDVPLSAKTFELTLIAPIGSSTAYPVIVDEGVAYVEYGANRIMAVISTGYPTTPWRVTDVSKEAHHLINNPVSLALSTSNSQAPERYVFVLNGDGTLACMFYSTDPPRVGWTPWDTDGTYNAMVCIRGIIHAVCERVIGGVTTFTLERLDETSQLDCSSTFDNPDGALPLVDGAGDPITGGLGEIETGTFALTQLAGQSVHVIGITDGFAPNYLGEHLVGADGSLSDVEATDGTSFEAGLHFTFDAIMWPAEPERDQSPMFGRRRIPRVAVRTKESGVYGIGVFGRARVQIRASYDQGDDIGLPPPLRTEVKRYIVPGWEYEPCIEITRPIPHPVEILSVAREVAY